MHHHTAEIRSVVSQLRNNLTFWRCMDFTGRWRFAIRVWLQLGVRQNKKHRKTFIETHTLTPTLTICDDKRVSGLSCEEEGRRCNTPITPRIRIRKQWGCLMVSFRLIGGNVASLLTLCQEWPFNQKCELYLHYIFTTFSRRWVKSFQIFNFVLYVLLGWWILWSWSKTLNLIWSFL